MSHRSDSGLGHTATWESQTRSRPLSRNPTLQSQLAQHKTLTRLEAVKSMGQRSHFATQNFVQLQMKIARYPMMHFICHMTHSPYPVPQLPPHLRHALSNRWSKTSLCSLLKAPCHQEKPHVVFLERAYFWA